MFGFTLSAKSQRWGLFAGLGRPHEFTDGALEQLEAASKCRRPSAPPHVSTYPAFCGLPPIRCAPMAHNKAGVVIKNTFLEVGDQISTFHDWRRQMSEPVKIYTSVDPDEDYDDEAEEGEAEVPEEMPPLPFSIAPPSTSSTHPGSGHLQPNMGVLDPGALPQSPGFEASPPPYVPRQSSQVKDQNANKVSRQGPGINALKNNDITSKEPPWNDVTTVMMRNLPNKYRQQMLLDELADAGFRVQSDFDFFYLPMDHSNAANLGYCFINFTEPALANSFAAAFQGKKMRRFNSHKTVVVMPASIQGYDRNYKYYSSTRVAQAEDPAYRPLFLRHPDLDSQDRKGAGRGGKGGDKGRGKKGSKGSKGPQDGKGVEAFGRLAFMGLEDPNAQGDWSMATDQMPWQPPQMMAAPFPGCGGCCAAPCAAPCGGRSGNTVTCTNCGNVCSAEHRFCSACGAPVKAGTGGPGAGPSPTPSPAPMGGKGGPCAGPPMNGMIAGCPVWGCGGCCACPCPMNMRADAPTFMPCVGEDDGSQQQTTPQMTDSVNTELDVMRGRLMLIAALKLSKIDSQILSRETPRMLVEKTRMSLGWPEAEKALLLTQSHGGFRRRGKQPCWKMMTENLL
eukprot:s408_g28.t2